MGVVRAATGVIGRARVEGPLREAILSSAVTIVQAPLGTGKTTAIASALAGRPAVAWVDARPWHRDDAVAAIVHAARVVREDFGRMTLGAVAAGAQPDRIARMFSEDLQHFDDAFIVVIDNAHEFIDDTAFAHFIEALIGTLPGHAHIVLSGRRLPPMMLGEGVARRRTAIVDGALLAFSGAEIGELAQRLGRDLDAAALTETIAATQGWAAGVVLALASPNTMLATEAGPRGAAVAFLAEQLLPTLDPAVIAFLERASVLETIDLRIVAQAPAFADAEQHLIALQRSGALVSDLGSNRYRLHPILRELAGAGLRAQQDVEAAHRDAAAAYASAGELSAALFHTYSAGSANAAAAFLRAHAEGATATGDHGRVRAVAQLIDAAGADADVRAYATGLLEKARGAPSAREEFARAAAAADDSGDAKIAFSARAHVVQHDLGRLAVVADGALDDLHRRATTLGVAQMGAAVMLRGWSLAVDHDFDAALATVSQLVGMGDAATRFNVGILHAYALTACGDIEAAEEALDELVLLLENDDRVVLQTTTLVWFARLALIWGHTLAASDAAAQAQRLAGALDLRAEEAALYVALAETASHAGDADATLRYAENARARAKTAWYAADVIRARVFADIALARVAFLRGEYTLARDIALRTAGGADTPGTQRALALAEGAVYALLSAHTGAGAIIAEAHAAVTAAAPVDAADAVAISVADDLLAFLRAANGEAHQRDLPHCAPFARLLANRNGLATLELAGVAVANARAARGSAQGFDSIFDLLQRNGPRFDVLLAHAYAAHFVKPAAAAAVPVQTLDLTPREVDILALLVDGLTNKEIAQKLIVSPRTVETHVERVLGKLEVGSRSRAIAKALRLGIVALEAQSN